MSQKDCLFCFKTFHVKPSHMKIKSYCSSSCMAEDYKTRYIGSNNPNYKHAGYKRCNHCGAEYHSYIKSRKYCSSVCYNKTRPKKPKIKKNVIQFNKNPCPYCGNGHLGEKSATCGIEACKEAHNNVRKAKTLKKNEKTCDFCGKLFSAPNGRRYCSYKCHIDSGGAIRAGAAASKMTRIYGAKKDANHKEIVDAFKKMGADVMDMSTVGKGMPDLTVWCRGQWHLVDVKNPNTGYGRRGLNPIQTAWAENWKGGPVYLIYSVEDAALLVNGKIEELKCVGGYDKQQQARNNRICPQNGGHSS